MIVAPSLFRIMREVLLAAYRNKRHNKVLSLFVLLIESGTLYVCALVSDLLVTSYVTGTNETVQRMISCISGYSTVQFVVRCYTFPLYSGH